MQLKNGQTNKETNVRNLTDSKAWYKDMETKGNYGNLSPLTLKADALTFKLFV